MTDSGEGARSVHASRGRGKASADDAPPAPDTHARAEGSSPVASHEPAETCCAGLFFLLPLMSRLGVAAFLEADPRLVELDFPRRLLRHLCERLRVPADDPAVRALAAEDEPAGPRDACEFVTPQAWRGLYSPGPLRLARAGADGRARVLTDGSGRLALALWRGRAPARVRALTERSGMKRSGALKPAGDLSLLLEAWVRVMRRWCRRRAGLGLCELARRGGRLRATRTHLDLFFDYRRADVRVRLAGLDLDPGWVPWFGRVVQFHYRDWGQGDGDC